MKKRICLLIYNLGSGGAERVLSQWSILLSDKYEVYMTVFDAETAPHYEFYGNLYNLNVKADNGSFFKKVAIVLKRARELKKFVKRNKIDMVLSFCNEANLANTLSMHGAKTVCSIRSVSDLTANIFVKYVLLAKHNRLILQTEALRAKLIEQYGERINKKISVFGNPFNTDYIKNKASEKAPQELESLLQENTTIINVASLKEVKNHENLLRSFELVSKEVPGVYLLLVGADSAGRELKLKEMASQSMYADHILFVGEMENPFSLVSKSTIFVLPSLMEGIPNALAEAMICGIPVIASNCPTGPKELLSDQMTDVGYNEKGYCICEYGILVKPFEKSADMTYEYNDENHYLANAIIDTLKDKELLNQLKTKSNNGAKRFDYNIYKKDLSNLVDALLVGKGDIEI